MPYEYTRFDDPPTLSPSLIPLSPSSFDFCDPDEESPDKDPVENLGQVHYFDPCFSLYMCECLSSLDRSCLERGLEPPPTMSVPP